MIQTRFYLFGRFEVWCGDERLNAESPQKACELMAYLLIHATPASRRDQLASLLWPDVGNANARSYLRKALWQIQSIHPDIQSQFLIDAEWITPVADSPVWVDAAAFEGRYRSVQGLSGADLSADQYAAICRAIDLYRDDLLSGWYQEWALLERERFLRMNLILLDKAVEYSLCHGLFEAGIEHASRLLRWDQTRERTHRHLMRLYCMVGDRTAAIRQFKRCRSILGAELGVDPSMKTLALYRAVQTDASAVPPVDGTVPVGRTEATRMRLLEFSHFLTQMRSTIDLMQEQIHQELDTR